MSTGKKPTVLIVDDVAVTAEAISKLFTQLDFQPVVCLSVSDAMRHAEAEPVELAIVDIFMPRIGGLEGIQRLKKQRPGIKIIAMTSGRDEMSTTETLRAAEEAGADAMMKKPVLKGDLEGVIGSIFG